MIQGLSSSRANQLLKEVGFNELPSAQPKNVFRIALEVVKEPMFLLLLSCGTLYIILGDYQEGIILLSAIFVIIGITFYQSQKTERALEALKNLSSPRALVMRDGKEMRIAGREVVPSDVLILNEGDRIAADATVIDSLNLTVDESLLTGESIPVTKVIDTDKSTVFSGTLVVQGKGMAEVTATGIHSQFGKIGLSLKNIDSDETQLQKEMKVLIKKLSITGIFICVLVVAAFYYSRGNFIHSLLNGLASAMAILPEEFPVVLTIFLALGAWRLSQKNVLTRRPSAIETLGSATVLCTDKTGTITQNKMEVAILYDGSQIISHQQFEKEENTFSQLLRVGSRASQHNSIDPMEQAIQKSHELTSTQRHTHTILREYPLSKKLLAMTRVLQNNNDQSTSISAKGAPETIFELCHLSKEETTKHLKVVHEMANQGYRVIAVADAQHPTQLPDTQAGFDFSFLGLIGLEDPIRPEVPQAVKECSEAGVKVIMITGDFPTTAKSIAQQIGLSTEGQVITGNELSVMSDEELKEKIKRTTIFARIIPEQKLRIVQALKANGEIVAMTGDGVNDAPALKASNIGVAMGNKGTDVAREASSLVLLDDNFASIVSAIHSGRRIYDNLQKAMSYIMAIHIPIIGLTLLPAFFPSLPILLLPLHIVFMELIIDPVCTIAFESEQDEKGIMQRKPRNPSESFFGTKRVLFSVFAGALLLLMVLIVYFLSINEGHTEGEVRAIAFSSLIIGNIFLILTDLSKTRSFISVFAERNWAAILILIIALTMLLLIITLPSFQSIFSFQFPGFQHFIPSLIAATVILVILEAIKYWRR
ncbi:MAG: cation-translocating P-type ATPase [Cyclobacteriaceae bacterium]